MTTNNPALKDLPITEEDLPIWMRRAMRGNDWGALLTIGFSALVAWYFILSPTLPQFNSTENYVFMAQDYANAIEEGRLYPRWAAHTHGGYGAPIYNYAPPGAPYLSGVITVLFTDDPVTAVRTVYLIGFMMAGVGTYGIVVRHRGAAAAVLAASLYVTSPYIAVTAPHALGNLSVSLALGILPVFLWSIDRLVYANYPQDFPFVTLSFAALLLTVPKIALAGVIIAVALVIWHLSQRNPRLCHPRMVVLALLTGGLIAGFYWIPAIGEQVLVTWQEQPLTTTPVFVTLSGIFAAYTQVDAAALVPQPQLSFGWLRIGLVLLSIPGVIRVQRQFSIEGLALLCGFATTIAALLIFPLETWLIGVATLCFSASIGAALTYRDRFSLQVQRLVLAITLLVILGASRAAWLPSEPTSAITSRTAQDQVQYETGSYGIATVPQGTRYPTTLPASVSLNSELLRSYREETDSLNRINTTRQSNSLRVSPLDENSHSMRFQITSDGIQRIDLALAYFPGWQARIANRQLTTRPDNDGFLTVLTTDAVNDTLIVWLGSTNIRRTAWIITGFAAVGLLWATRRRYRNAMPRYHEVQLLTLPEVRLILLLLTLSIGVMYTTARFNAPLSIRAQPGSTLENATELNLRTNTGMNLLAYDLNRTEFQHGDALLLHLYWSSLQEIRQNYRIQITLFGIDETISLSKPVIRYPGGIAPTRWTQNQYVTDTHYIEITASIPPGEYLVEIMLEVCSADNVCNPADRPRFFERDGYPVGQVFELPDTIEVIE